MILNDVFKGYVECAIWSSIDEDEEGFLCIDDLSEQTAVDMKDELRDFCHANLALLVDSGLPDEHIGHNFWLTRNGHGCGFWSRGLGKIGDELTIAAKVYGSVYMYANDGKFYCD